MSLGAARKSACATGRIVWVAVVAVGIVSGAGDSSKRMADGKEYTWESARRACQALGEGRRLPTDDEWQRMAKHYGGVRDDSEDGGKAAYQALLTGGGSGFNAVFGGGRAADGQYARLEAHGFYWTASESGAGSAWFYNLGKGGLILNHHNDGEKVRAFAVRCIRD